MACCGGAHIWKVIHMIKDYLIFKNTYIENQYYMVPLWLLSS